MSILIAAVGAVLFFFGFGFAFFRLIWIVVKAKSAHPNLPDKQARIAHDKAFIRSRIGSVFIPLGIALVGGAMMVSVA